MPFRLLLFAFASLTPPFSRRHYWLRLFRCFSSLILLPSEFAFRFAAAPLFSGFSFSLGFFFRCLLPPLSVFRFIFAGLRCRCLMLSRAAMRAARLPPRYFAAELPPCRRRLLMPAPADAAQRDVTPPSPRAADAASQRIAAIALALSYAMPEFRRPPFHISFTLFYY
jgi:hypothetical protein